MGVALAVTPKREGADPLHAANTDFYFLWIAQHFAPKNNVGSVVAFRLDKIQSFDRRNPQTPLEVHSDSVDLRIGRITAQNLYVHHV